jgi:two-component system sensor histidine kinase ChvG
VRIVDTNGIVLATSGPRLGESLADRPEVQEALRGGSSVAVRTEMPPPLVVPRADDRKAEPLTWAYATVPIAPRGRVVGAVLLTRPTRGVLDAAHDMRHDLGAGVLVALAFTVSMATWLGWRLSRSLRRVARVAHDLADDPTPGSPAVETALATLADTRVSEVRAIAQAFARLVERLDQRLRYNQEFAGNVAHEFKTPLATLRGTIDLLTDDTAMPAEQRALFLTNARTDLDRLDRMVSGLLALARAETPPVRARVALTEILEDLRDHDHLVDQVVL